MKINILGSNGTIGLGLRNVAKNEFNYFSRNSTDNFFSLEKNISFSKKIKNLGTNDVVLFLSALSKPNLIEDNLELSIEVNYINTIKSIDLLLKNKVKVLFASTDQVYGDEYSKKILETDEANPINLYSYTKRLIEERYKHHDNIKFLRFSQCINGYDSFSKYCKESIKFGKTIELFKTYKRNIFGIDLLYEFLVKLKLNEIHFNNIPNFINFGGSYLVNRSEFQKFLNDSIVINKVKSKTFIFSIDLNTSALEKIMKKKYIFNFTDWKNKIYE
tara:strand:+ start:488 stop:1309 length:822 start_codon:yes stop_codon:yes gene_type:complete